MINPHSYVDTTAAAAQRDQGLTFLQCMGAPASSLLLVETQAGDKDAMPTSHSHSSCLLALPMLQLETST